MKYFDITIHAVEQFIRRWEPNKKPTQAREELDALLRTSRAVGKTHAGDTIVASGYRPEVRIVIKERNVAVTVLPQGPLDHALLAYDEELKEALRMYEDRSNRIQCEIKELEEEADAIQKERIRLADKRSSMLNRVQALKQELDRHVKLLGSDVVEDGEEK